MGVLASELLDGAWSPTVAVSLAENGVDRAALDRVVAGADLLLGRGGGLIEIVGDVVALALQFGDGGLELRNRCRDVGQLDDVGERVVGELPQFGEVIGGATFRLIQATDAPCLLLEVRILARSSCARSLSWHGTYRAPWAHGGRGSWCWSTR